MEFKDGEYGDQCHVKLPQHCTVVARHETAGETASRSTKNRTEGAPKR